MAKRGRKPLPRDFERWRVIYQEVWDLNVAGDVQLTAACNEVGERHGMQGQRVRKLVKKMEEHHLAMRRMIERANRGPKRN
jgi:hypothetical protein